MVEFSWDIVNSCRACGSAILLRSISFGMTPIADKISRFPESDQPNPTAPLEMLYCESCHLFQLSANVAPSFLYDEEYPYYSSVSPALNAHFARSAARIIQRHSIGPKHTVIEAASNDGYLLRHFQNAGAKVLGIDPSLGPAGAADMLGIETRRAFFAIDLAKELSAAGIQADIFLANNVLAHVPDLSGFIRAIATILKPDGSAYVEVPYVRDLVEGGEFDTIYHQHLCYFSVTSLVRAFRAAGLCVANVERTSIHGGSLRLQIQHGATSGENVQQLLVEETQIGIVDGGYLDALATSAARTRDELRTLLAELVNDGKSVFAYGAAAKGTTLLSWCGMPDFPYVADKNQKKHGYFMPGTNTKIVSPDAILMDQPDYVLILAWNFADEIMTQLSEYKRRGGRFIVPIPSLKVV